MVPWNPSAAVFIGELIKKCLINTRRHVSSNGLCHHFPVFQHDLSFEPTPPWAVGDQVEPQSNTKKVEMILYMYIYCSPMLWCREWESTWDCSSFLSPTYMELYMCVKHPSPTYIEPSLLKLPSHSTSHISTVTYIWVKKSHCGSYQVLNSRKYVHSWSKGLYHYSSSLQFYLRHEPPHPPRRWRWCWLYDLLLPPCFDA